MINRQTVSIIAVFSALAVSSNYAMLPFFQVKLMDSIVFICAYLFGFSAGAGVASITWIVYGSINPLGAAGFPLLFVLIIGEMIFAASGALLGKAWKRTSNFGKDTLFNKNVILGFTGLFSALAYDLWTNAIDGFIIYNSLEGVFLRIITGAYFAVVHEVADFFFFVFVVPLLIVSISRISRLKVV